MRRILLGMTNPEARSAGRSPPSSPRAAREAPAREPSSISLVSVPVVGAPGRAGRASMRGAIQGGGGVASPVFETGR